MSLTVSPSEIVERSDSPLLAAPDAWPRRPLGDVATILNGFAFKSKQFAADGGMPLIRIRDIFDDHTTVGFVGAYDKRYLVHPDELLVGMDGDFNCSRWRGPEALLNQRVCKITPDATVIDLDFLTYVLPGYLQAIHDFTSSTTVTHLSSRDIARIPIPVPSLGVQKELARLFMAVASKQQSSEAHLRVARRALGRYRQAILTAACSGRLTEEWRSECGAQEWRYAPASEVCVKIQSGGTPKSGFTDRPGIPFLKVYNIVDQQVDFAYRPQYVPVDVHRGVLRKSIACPGDVIMNIVGPPLGKAAIIPDDYPEWNLNQAITIFRPGTRIVAEWLYLYFCSGSFMDDEDLVTRGSAGQSNISLTQCRNLVVPVPSIDEQREIIRRVNEILAVADYVEQRVSCAVRSVGRSAQAVLVKAFRGGLSTDVEPEAPSLARDQAVDTVGHGRQ